MRKMRLGKENSFFYVPDLISLHPHKFLIRLLLSRADKDKISKPLTSGWCVKRVFCVYCAVRAGSILGTFGGGNSREPVPAEEFCAGVGVAVTF